MPRCALIAVIRTYQVLISPLFPTSCRFYPSCSQYGVEAVTKYGIITGCRLILTRLAKCRPFGPSGYDPVP